MKTMWRKWRKAHLFYSTIFIGALNTAFDVKYHFFHFILLSNNVSLCMATASETPKAHTHTHTVIYPFLLILKTDLINFLLVLAQ